MAGTDEHRSFPSGFAKRDRYPLLTRSDSARPVGDREMREAGRHFRFRGLGGGLAAVQSRERSITERTRSGSALPNRIRTAGQPS